ncbi:MAG: PAS domain S-box protein [Solirubrobacteraceae bacterium]
MAFVTCDILVLSPTALLREDLAQRLTPLTQRSVQKAATIEDALPLLAGGRHVVVADSAAGDAATFATRLPEGGGSVGIVVLADEPPAPLPIGVVQAVPATVSDLELGLAVGQAAQHATAARTRTDAARELEELASLMPDTAALLFDKDLVCQLAKGPLIDRILQQSIDLTGQTAAQMAGPRWQYTRPYWEAALRGSRQRFDYDVEETGHVYAADLIPRRAGGRVIDIACVIADVSAQRRAETAEAEARDQLARSEARYRAMVDNLHEGVALLDADGRWVANASAQRILGLTAAQLAGEDPLPEGWTATDAEGTPIPLRDLPGHRTRRTGVAHTDLTLGLRLPDGTTRWLLVNAEPIPGQTDPARRDVLSSFIDVTAQREAERALASEHADLAEAQALARVGSFRIDLSDMSWTWSDEACRIFGRSPGDPPADFAGLLEHVHPDDQEFIARTWAQRQGQPAGPMELYFRLRHRGGVVAYVHLRAHAERDATGRASTFAGIVQDISERQEAELALRAAQRRFEAAFDEAPIGMILMDADGRNVRVNRAICELLGHSHAELLHRRHGVMTDTEQTAEDLQALGDLLAGTVQRWSAERRVIASDGRAMWVQLSAARLQVTPDEPPMILVHYLDISHRHRLERRLRHLAEHDPLTGVPNRRAWEAQVPQAIEEAARSGAPLAVALLDLNAFKAVNDTLGHDAGDRVLREVAAAWRGQLRDSDLLARLGGDEFAVLLPDCGQDDLSELARRLRTALRYHPGCSVGAVTWHPGEKAENLVRRADEALYRDKLASRDVS